jgi:hypothetical protein
MGETGAQRGAQRAHAGVSGRAPGITPASPESPSATRYGASLGRSRNMGTIGVSCVAIMQNGEPRKAPRFLKMQREAHSQ